VISKRKDPHAVALGRRGGSVTSDAKAHAARTNALKGGRKPKFQPGDRVIGRDDGPASFRERTGTVLERVGRADYRVQFDDDQIECVMSWWMDAV
jgi:hypothetical protein